MLLHATMGDRFWARPIHLGVKILLRSQPLSPIEHGALLAAFRLNHLNLFWWNCIKTYRSRPLFQFILHSGIGDVMSPASQGFHRVRYRRSPPDLRQLRCPTCKSYDVRRSMRRNFIDAVLDLIGLAPYRCRSCRCLFHRSY